MPEDFMSLFGAPHLIRRYAALHAKSAEIFYALATATEQHDHAKRDELIATLAGLAEEQTGGRGYVAPPEA